MARLLVNEILKKKGLSKRQFALLMQLRYENVFRIFRPGYNPRLNTIAKIAKALNVRICDLIKD